MKIGEFIEDCYDILMKKPALFEQPDREYAPAFAPVEAIEQQTVEPTK